MEHTVYTQPKTPPILHLSISMALHLHLQGCAGVPVPSPLRFSTPHRAAVASRISLSKPSLTLAARSVRALVPLSRRLQVAQAASAQAGASADSFASFPAKLNAFMDMCWRFLRPHTIHGTCLCSVAMMSRGLIENPNLIEWSLLIKAAFALLGLILGNGYIVGINQIYDIGIDRVNKPYLPIAAGDISVGSAWLLVLFFAIIGLSIVASISGPFLTSLYLMGLFLGTVYSVPPFRLKRSPIAAFLIIASVRGFLLNFGVYYAVRATLGFPFAWSPPVVFITTFATLFALVIAITKDLPDVEGDRKFKIPTFATELGVRNIAFMGSGILLLNYIGSILAAIYMPRVFRPNIMIASHAVLAFSLINQAWLLEKANYTKEANRKFYRFIWKLFYAEYAIFPFI